MSVSTLIAHYSGRPLLAFAEAYPVDGRPFGDRMHGYQREWFTNIEPALRSMIAGEEPADPLYFIEASKGAGKDLFAAIVIDWVMMISPRPLSIEVGAGDQEQAAEVRKHLQHARRSWPELEDVNSVTKWASTNPHTGSECAIRSTEAATSHGSRPDLLVMNELSHCGSEDFASTLLDNAAKVRCSVTLVMTNAGIEDSWQHKWRQTAIDLDVWTHWHFGEPAPHISDRIIDAAARRNTSFRQAMLYHTVWCPDTGEGLDHGDIQRAVGRLLGPTRHADGDYSAIVVGLDGSVRRDHTGMVVLGVNPVVGTVDLLEVHSWEPQEGEDIDFAAVEAAVLDVDRRHGDANVVFDPPQLQYLAQRLSLHGLNCIEWYSTPKHLDQMADSLLASLRNSLLRLFSHPQLEADLRKLVIVQRPTGQKLEAKRDRATGHADRGFALATALPAALQSLYDHQRWAEREDQPELRIVV